MEEEKKTNWKNIIVGIFNTIRISILIGLLIVMILIIKECITTIVNNTKEEQEKEKNIMEQANGNPVIDNISFEFVGWETKTRKN